MWRFKNAPDIIDIQFQVMGMSLRTQDLLFTLYGDYLGAHGGEASVGSLVGLMGCFDVSQQAVRSTLSRMSRKGWLQARQVGRNSLRSLEPEAEHINCMS